MGRHWGQAIFRSIALALAFVVAASAAAHSETTELMRRAYDNCVGKAGSDVEKMALCACEVAVLAEAKLSDEEWNAISEKFSIKGLYLSGAMKHPVIVARPKISFARCQQSKDTIADVLSRYARTAQCRGTPPKDGPTDSDIRRAANEFIIQDCSRLALFMSAAKGERRINPLAVAGTSFERRGESHAPCLQAA